MAEADLTVNLDQPRRSCRVQRRVANSEVFSRTPQKGGIAERLGGRGHHQQPGRFRQCRESPLKALFDPARQRQRRG